MSSKLFFRQQASSPGRDRFLTSPGFSLQLAKYPTIANLEKTTGVPKAYAAIGLAALYLFLIIFNLGGQLLTNIAGFVIPGYYSLNALFTTNTADDTQWLTVSFESRKKYACAQGYFRWKLTLFFPVLGRLRLLLVRGQHASHSLRLPRSMLTCALSSVIESLVSVVYWFPFYFTFKFIFLLWLSLPTFRYAPFLSQTRLDGG
jgi:receptor expression-enhancing protein 5/6